MDDRYSSQIMRHLLNEADAWPGQPPAVGLFVHPNNSAAIKLYERFAFQPFFHTYTDPDTAVVYPPLWFGCFSKERKRRYSATVQGISP